MKCSSCGAVNDSVSHFCGKCGESLKQTELKALKWQRGVEDFATRIDVEDLRNPLVKGIIVEQGTRALLLQNGALMATLEPGRYEMKTFTEALHDSSVRGIGSLVKGVTSFFSKDKAESIDKAIDDMVTHDCTVILIDSGDVDLNLNMTGIYTKDPLNIDITCKVIAQIESPTFFFNNVMKGRKSYLVSELRSSLHDEMQNAFNEVIGKKSVTDLNWDLSLKHQFEVSVEDHLRTTFQRNGLNFIQLRTIDYKFKRYDEVKKVYEEAFVLVSQDEAELQKRKRLFDVYDQKQLQDIFEQTKEVQYREQRQKVWADMRQLINSDKMNEVKSADDLEAYLHEINKGKYLREDEVQELLNTFKQSGLRRDFLLEKIILEQKLEYERIELVGREENKLAEWEVKARGVRRDLEEKIRNQKDLKAAEREIKVEDGKAEREIRVEDAKAEGTVKDIEREGDQKDLDMGLAALERVKKIKAQEEREKMEIETERIKRLSAIGIEALISASGKEQAMLLAELKKTEMLKGMSEKQILAMAEKGDGAVAMAIFQSDSALVQEKLLRERVTDKDQAIKTMQEMYNKALETQRDATIGVSQGGRVVYPPSGYPGPGTGGPGGQGFYNVNMNTGSREKVIICKNCKHENIYNPDRPRCTNCGENLFE